MRIRLTAWCRRCLEGSGHVEGEEAEGVDGGLYPMLREEIE